MTEENTTDGLVRLRFARVRVGMSPTLCGLVTGPNDALAFTRHLQERLRDEPGCETCEIDRIDLVVLVDAELILDGRWQEVGSFGDRSFVTSMPDPFDAAASPEVQLEHAHFYFMRDGEAYEAFLDRLCPSAEADPDALLPRVVSDACARFTERPAPHMRRPGLLREEE